MDTVPPTPLQTRDKPPQAPPPPKPQVMLRWISRYLIPAGISLLLLFTVLLPARSRRDLDDIL